MAKRGIDISEHQGNIDLNNLKNEIDFVIIRAGFGTKGRLDSKFRRNADLCKQLGIPFGFYWYSYALDVDGARREADAIINALIPYKDSYSYGVWFDMEDADHYKRNNGMPSNETLQNMCEAFCLKLEEAGYYTGIYASSSWFKNQLNNSKLDRFDKWVAHWPVSGGSQSGLNTNENGEDANSCGIWQFTSDARFNGYSGRLDADYSYKDYVGMIRDGNIPEPKPNPQPSKSIDELAHEVINGVWGNGDDRKNRLINAGYDYNAIQDRVNEILNQNNQPTYKTYTVKSGDTLSGIGAKTNTSWKEIANINGINSPYTIYPGQVLKLPGSGNVPTPEPTYTTYKIKSGDTLSGIAAKFGTTVNKLAQINNISNPNKIYAGQVIKIA